ncbi:MAG: hypothetical protein ACE5I7_16080 [Candidatus Binatia bacterium]
MLNAAVWRLLGIHGGVSPDRIGGLGGVISCVSIETTIRFASDASKNVLFHGEFAAVTELEALDICVLGRDIAGLFAVIVDQPHNIVCLLRERHRYAIEGA